MTKPELMHGCDFDGQDLTGWFASEKLNGWRCVWTGRELVSRSGRAFNAPQWFTAGLPSVALDCELWLGRGHDHNDVNRALAAGQWTRLRLSPFDVAQPSLAIEAAIALLRSFQFPPPVTPVEFVRLESTSCAFRLLAEIVTNGGEGIVVRKAGSSYTASRTKSLLKLKEPNLFGFYEMEHSTACR